MSQEQTKSELKVVMGCMTFGGEGKEGARVHDLKTIGEILDIFQAHGHSELDTARVYAGGTSEEVLGEVGWQKRELIMETKLYPTGAGRTTPAPAGVDLITHSPEDLRKFLDISLKALQTDSIEMWYLHGPDRGVPYEVTLKTVNDLYKEGKFKRFGISNYQAWEVAEMVQICKYNGYIQPTAYQGIYNAIHRRVEPELFPCLRKYGISFYEYNPLGGGFFTGRYRSIQDTVEPGSRFDPERNQGQNYRKRYWNESYFHALSLIESVAQKHNLTLAEVALRWLSHHSQLKKEYGDAVIIGASSKAHIEQNLVDLEKGPLPEEVVKALDEAWVLVQGVATNYWH
ncbi:Aldo/keto reductase [Irpex rosettiformis]|uniref:Aldo/keto reductase n=1 Tax=Irpex rosettiformis TaxID=378272 RepID=A0ACB8TQG7_9APHY|nr:Aldo/keto reductase [Irpex rosettiformis]